MASTKKRGNSYTIIVSCGYDINGKKITKSMIWKPTSKMTEKQIEKEVARQATLFEEKCKTGQSLKGNIKFADFSELWFKDYAEKQLKFQTLYRYKDIIKRVNSAIGHISLEKIQPHHLITFYGNLAEDGIRMDNKYKCIIDFNELLQKEKLTKVALANLAGVSVRTLYAIAQGENITEKSATKISSTLKISQNKIFELANTTTKLSSKTILEHHRLISSILNTAVQWQIILSNPCERVKPPKTQKTKPRYLDDKQAIELLTLLENEKLKYQVAIKLLLYTGFRRGELCGLEWDDIDFEKKVIHSNRESLYRPGKGIYDEDGKTDESLRPLKVADFIIDMLSDYKIHQLEQRLKMGDKWISSNRLFTKENGKAIFPDTISAWFRKFIKKTELPYISIHSLRHTNATLMIANGIPLTTVASRLGHANTITTSKVYVHAIRSADEAAAEILQDILHPNYKKA